MNHLVRSFTTVLLVLLAVSAGAETFEGRCAIRFYGESTLHDFEGQGACDPFILQTEKVAERQLIRSPLVTVPVAGMDTDNDSRDEKMREMFDSDHYPLIRGTFADLDPEQVLGRLAGGGPEERSLEFDLRIRDVTQRVGATASGLTISPEKIDFELEFPVSLESYGLEPPSVFGLIRVADRVRVVVRVILYRRAGNAE